MKVLGIDEAGRGPVVGPMVIAGVVVDEKGETGLERMRVRDSKLLSRKRREQLAVLIRKIAVSVHVVEVTAAEIDRLRKRMSLNEVEAMKMARIIDEAKADKVIIDLPDPTAVSFKRRIMRYCSGNPEFVMEHKADQKYPVVSAASIIAKTVRDQRMREIEEKYGVEIGTGYPHDERTINFLKARSADYPIEVRRSWSTARRNQKKKQQKTLAEY